MTRDEFRQQMELYRQAREQNPQLSYWQWKANRPQDNDWQYQQWRSSLPKNLRSETLDYDLYGAYKAGMQPQLESDGFYHLGSRDPYTGRILKTKNHPTYQHAIQNEIEAGYFPYEKDEWTYTKTYSPTGDLSGYKDGTDKNGVPDSTISIIDSPYEDLHFQYEKKPRFELRKGTDLPIRYTSKNFIKFLSNMSKGISLLGMVSYIPQYLFPSEEAEAIEDLRYKIKQSNDRLLGKFSSGTDKKGIQSTSERPVTVNPYTGEFEYGYNPGAGYLKSVIDTRDLLDFTPVGNATTAYDSYNAYDAGNYLGAGLIGATAILPGAIAKPAKKLIKRVIPTVNPNYVSNKINEVLGKPNKVLANGLDSELYTDVINQRNRIIEDLIEDSDYWDRAAQIYRQYGDDYIDAYSNIMEGYWNNYLGFPEPKLGAQGAMAQMGAKQSAIDRYNSTGEPAGMYDFEYQINPDYNIDYPITRHELSHYVDFNVAKSPNADRNNTMFSEMKKDLSKGKNPMYPNNTDYFRKGTEQKSYMNTLRQYMFDTGQIKSIGQKVNTKQIKAAINSLPSQYNSVKAAYQQFVSPSKYTKWFNKIPLLGIPGAAMYINNKETDKSN